MDLLTPIPPLRSLDVKRIRHNGAGFLLLRDPLELAGPDPVLVPLGAGAVLAQLDGRRHAAAVAAELLMLTGQTIDPADIARFVRQLSDACLLDDERTTAARAAALAAYHAAPYRPLAHADRVYPADPALLHNHLLGFEPSSAAPPVADGIAGVVSPHIDFARGGPVYAHVWRAARAAARAADLVVIFGTDHCGGLNRITLTRQDYATPWGRLPTDAGVRDAVAAALGDAAFEQELHHRGEHSIELAAVWLHHARNGEPVPIVPILCGHPGAYMAAGRIETATPAGLAIAALRHAAAGRRLLAIAAADLAHAGPAFGDGRPFGQRDRAVVQAADQALIDSFRQGAAGLLAGAARIDDQFRVCGLAPIACMLELIGPSEPQTVAYDQCPADDDGGSFVSVAGVVARPIGA